jgi:hypothetical protein
LAIRINEVLRSLRARQHGEINDVYLSLEDTY